MLDKDEIIATLTYERDNARLAAKMHLQTVTLQNTILARYQAQPEQAKPTDLLAAPVLSISWPMPRYRMETGYMQPDERGSWCKWVDVHPNMSAQEAKPTEAQPFQPADEAFGQEVTRLIGEIRSAKSLAMRDSLIEELIELIEPSPAASAPAQPEAKGPDLDDALSAVLWLYHRLPHGYDRQSHIERVVRSLARATGSDADVLLFELGREAEPVPAAPADKGELPKPDTHCYDEDTKADVWSYSAEAVRAILAERARQAIAQPSGAAPIERFSIYEDHGRANMMGDDDGEYVLYSHHVEALAASPQPPASTGSGGDDAEWCAVMDKDFHYIADELCIGQLNRRTLAKWIDTRTAASKEQSSVHVGESIGDDSIFCVHAGNFRRVRKEESADKFFAAMVARVDALLDTRSAASAKDAERYQVLSKSSERSVGFALHISSGHPGRSLDDYCDATIATTKATK